jgi:hypothetical protein
LYAFSGHKSKSSRKPATRRHQAEPADEDEVFLGNVVWLSPDYMKL